MHSWVWGTKRIGLVCVCVCVSLRENRCNSAISNRKKLLIALSWKAHLNKLEKKRPSQEQKPAYDHTCPKHTYSWKNTPSYSVHIYEYIFYHTLSITVYCIKPWDSLSIFWWIESKIEQHLSNNFKQKFFAKRTIILLNLMQV